MCQRHERTVVTAIRRPDAIEVGIGLDIASLFVNDLSSSQVHCIIYCEVGSVP